MSRAMWKVKWVEFGERVHLRAAGGAGISDDTQVSGSYTSVGEDALH